MVYKSRRLSLCRAAVPGGLGLRRQRQLCVGGDIADIAVVADETDLAVAPLEPHYVARFGINAVFENRDHLLTLDHAGEPFAFVWTLEVEGRSWREHRGGAFDQSESRLEIAIAQCRRRILALVAHLP